MDIGDLRSFLVIARCANLRSAAAELHQSPSALSKAIKRLEQTLNTPLFDRVGKSLRLNSQGEALLKRAVQLVALSDQTMSEFRGERQQLHCRIVGPAVLQWRFGAHITHLLKQKYPECGIAFATQFEDAALHSLAKGEADFAFVTSNAISGSLPAGVEAIAIGSLTMQLAAGRSHPIVQDTIAKKPNAKQFRCDTKQVLEYDFACPDRSLFCGLDRGTRSDGWRDDQLPRRIRFWLDDLQLLISLVRAGEALAYLPDFALEDPNLVRLQVSDCVYECIEECWLVWRPGVANGWQNKLVSMLQTR